MPELPMRVASPERRWRAATAPLIAAVIGWILSEALRLGVRRGTSPGLPLAAKIIVVCGAVVIGLSLAVLIARTRRAYSRIPSARHIDELYRISRTLEQAASRRAEQRA